MKLAIAACERPSSQPGAGTRSESADPLHGPEPDPKFEHASDPGHRAGTDYAQPTSAPPQRHPDDPDDPCASFSKVSSPEELHRSYARIKWIVSKLDAELERNDTARGFSTADAQGTNSDLPETANEEDFDCGDAYAYLDSDGWGPGADTEGSNTGFQAGRTTASSVLPLRWATDHYTSSSGPMQSCHGHVDGGTAMSPDRHEPATAPRSTGRPRPEHMVNAAVSVDRGVMIRAGSGAGSLVSDDGPIRLPEHVSANKKASPPAQDLALQAALGQFEVANCGLPTGGWTIPTAAPPTDALPGCSTLADVRNASRPALDHSADVTKTTANTSDAWPTPRPCATPRRDCPRIDTSPRTSRESRPSSRRSKVTVRCNRSGLP